MGRTSAPWFRPLKRQDKIDKSDEVEEAKEQQPKSGRYIPWNLLVLRCWAVDPELCPRCGETMRREKPLYKQPELSLLLQSLKGQYPERPPPTPPPARSAGPSHDNEFHETQQFGDNVVQLFPDDNFNQVPPGW